jgi:integrase/recombinase XerD
MRHKLVQECEDGKVVRLSLGVPEADAYLKFLRYRCRPNSWISYGYDLQVFLNTVSKSILEVTSADILAFVESQRSPRSGPKRSVVPGLCNRTIGRRLATIAGFYEYLRVFHDFPRNNPVPRGLTKRSVFWGNRYGSGGVTPLVRAPETLPRPLDDQEVGLFVDSLRSHRDKAMVLIMLLAGLRKSEVVKLTLRDVDFGQHTLFVREGKGGYERVAAISNLALKELLEYLDKERPSSSSETVFLALKGPHRGQPLRIAALDTIIKYHRRQAKTPGVQCHRMRHTCFTRLRQGGMSLEALQAQAGHKSIISTRVYLHLCPRELQQEYLRMSDKTFAVPTAVGRSDNG